MKQDKKKKEMLPPFTEALLSVLKKNRTDYDTPGHHSGTFFRLTPDGKAFYQILGKGIFEADISDSSSVIGDPSAHSGVTGQAENLAASVWGSDRCFFILGGTSASNRICANALLAEGDLVLFDRNNHKSAYQGAFLQAGARPVYLESSRNSTGIIGGLTEKDLDAALLRKKAAAIDPKAAKKERPFRAACLQLATYDGLFLNAEKILRTLGPLCDYILFDAAWAGYENFLPLLRESAVLRLSLTEKDPGILVTQSVHKQLCGFSMTSQIHKKDSHIREQKRYLTDNHLQHSCLMQISTSPYYPLLAGLEINASIHRKKGEEIWEKTRRESVKLRKKILKECSLVRPFVPAEGPYSWKNHKTEEILSDKNFFRLSPKDSWHGFRDLPDGLYTLDPCKILLTTGSFSDSSVPSSPAPLLSSYLEHRDITPEKCDFYTILFLCEPGDSPKKGKRLLSALKEWEDAWQKNVPMKDFMPYIHAKENEGLRDYSERFRLFLAGEQADILQQPLFCAGHFPPAPLTGKEAEQIFRKGCCKKTPLPEAEGKIALEPVLPYPPGICVLGSGETWTGEILSYFLFLQKYGEEFPDFSPEIVGIHDGKNGPYVWTADLK